MVSVRLPHWSRSNEAIKKDGKKLQHEEKAFNRWIQTEIEAIKKDGKERVHQYPRCLGNGRLRDRSNQKRLKVETGKIPRGWSIPNVHPEAIKKDGKHELELEAFLGQPLQL